jgi:hypothetical protein
LSFRSVAPSTSTELKRVFFERDADVDLNGDGVVNFADLAIMKKSLFKAPGPAAGKP